MGGMTGDELPSSALLETFVPHASDVSLEEALSAANLEGPGDESSPLSSIQQRSLLFFGRSFVRNPLKELASYLSQSQQMNLSRFTLFFALRIVPIMF